MHDTLESGLLWRGIGGGWKAGRVNSSMAGRGRQGEISHDRSISEFPGEGFPQKKQGALFIAPEPVNSSDNNRGVFEN